MNVQRQHRYQGGLAGALLIILIGVFLGRQWIVALAGIPLGFLIFAAISSVPQPRITVERKINPTNPTPSDNVTVELTVQNEGTTNLPDVRLVDGKPETLSVVDGTPSLSTALVPGEEETTAYTVSTGQGIHSFDPPQVRVRGLAANTYRDVTPTIEGDTEVIAQVFFDELPTTRETATLVGAVTSDTGGSGIEFHTVREYRPGDPVNRIEWRRFARDDELATVNFREYGGLAVCVIADCRPAGNISLGPGHSSGSELCQYAADRIIQSLAKEDHRTGLGVLGDSSFPWVSPDTTNVSVRARSALQAATDSTSWDGPELHLESGTDELKLVKHITKRLQSRTQLVFISPLGDDIPVSFVRQMVGRDYRVSVLSPNPVTSETAGARLVQAERATRIQQLREAGVTVIDWQHGKSLSETLATVTAGEST